MALPDAVIAHDDQVRRLTLAVLLNTRRLWDRLGTGDWDAAWRTLGPQMLAVMVAGQVAAGRQADVYVAATVAQLGIDPATDTTVSPNGLAGVASDGRPLASLLYEPIIAARSAGAAQNLDTAQALAVGREHLDRIVMTQVMDADRTASSVASVTHKAVTGWVRMAPPPCCPRCAVLAGRFYRWSSGFERHPQDDCTSIPATENVAGDMTTDPRKLIEAGQVHGLSAADAKAIKDGADPGQVINAHRGMSTAQVYGKTVKITSEGATSRGLAGQRLGRMQREQAGFASRITRNGPETRAVTQQRSQVPRLRPESIYKIAGDNRDEALRLLKRFGYVT